MNSKALILPAVVTVALGVVVVHWMREYAAFEVTPRVSGLDGRPQTTEEFADTGPIEGTLQTFDGQPSEITDTWPAFRRDFSGLVESSVELARKWPDSGPKEL